ncbi:MAG: hypothetical protein JST22_05920 [Bacteroidetes bacterium]|nr:hypothetical protein [Bacteroidota bacterium]
MLNRKLAIGIIVGVTAIGALLLVFQQWITGGIVTALGLGLFYFWWRINQINDVSQLLMAGKFKEAKEKLDKVKNPEKLNPYSKTYHYMLLGQAEIQLGNMKGARIAFKEALDAGRFQTTDQKASVLFMLAQVEFNAGNKEAAKRLLREAQDLNPEEDLMKQIKEAGRLMQQAPANLRWRAQQGRRR